MLALDGVKCYIEDETWIDLGILVGSGYLQPRKKIAKGESVSENFPTL